MELNIETVSLILSILTGMGLLAREIATIVKERKASKLEEIQTDITQLTAKENIEIEKMKTNSDYMTAVVQNGIKITEQNEFLRNQNEQLIKDRYSFDDKIEEFKGDCSRRISELKKEIENLTNERQMSHTKIEQLTSKIDTLNSEKEQMEDRINYLTRELSKYTKRKQIEPLNFPKNTHEQDISE